MYKQLIFIFLGGGFGSVFRFLVSQYTVKLWSINYFPLGTFVVNVLGCFFVGFLSNFITKDIFKLLFIVGFCGGFTTFSTLSLEGGLFLQTGNYGQFLLYTIASLVVGILFVWLGNIIYS